MTAKHVRSTTAHHHTPITRRAREAGERALEALRDLHDADPFVYVAFVESACALPVEPSNRREAFKILRARTHQLKVHAIEESLRTTERELELSERDAHAWSVVGQRLRSTNPEKYSRLVQVTQDYIAIEAPTADDDRVFDAEMSAIAGRSAKRELARAGAA
jgi:hypothetical protein